MALNLHSCKTPHTEGMASPAEWSFLFPITDRLQSCGPSCFQDQKEPVLPLVWGGSARTEEVWEGSRSQAVPAITALVFLPQHLPPLETTNYRVLVTEWWSWAGACSWAKSINMIMNTKQNVKNGWKNRCYWCFWQASAAVAEAGASRGKSFGGNWWQQGQEFLFVLFLQAFQETLSNFISRKNTVK